MIDKNIVERVKGEIDLALESILRHYNLNLVTCHSRYSSSEIKMSLHILEQTSDTEVSKEVTQEVVDYGGAKIGSILWGRDRDGEWYKARVLQARRTKYLFEWVDYLDEGKFLTSFRNLKVKI